MLHDFGRGHLFAWMCLSVLAALPSAPAQTCPFWQDVTPGPLPRFSSAMAYDSARGVTVLFGGWPRFGDTWEWNGTTWTQRATSGPAPRSRHHMVYDSARQVVVLFGGTAGGSNDLLNDTWEYDGTAWTQRATTGPQPRAAGGMAYDSGRGVTVLFGGRIDSAGTSPEDNQTWEWDGSNWTWREPLTVPPARTDCAMAYDAARGVTVLFGGKVTTDGAGTVPLTDTWEWDGTDWTQRTPIGPVPTGIGPMVYDPGRQVVVMHATVDRHDASAITWQWNGTAWLPVETGPAGLGQAMAFDSRRYKPVLFGGMADVPTGETWELQYGNWFLVATSGPLGALGAAMAYDSARQEAVLFGSYGTGYSPPSETWTYGSIGWEKDYWLFTRPSYRLGAAMAFDSDRGVSVLFGGQALGGAAFGETWQWNGNTWQLAAATGPSPRLFTAVAYDTARKVVVLFGGMSKPGNVFDGETWEWDGATWTLRSTSGPSARAGHAMAYDTARGVTVLFGGGDSESISGETWEWDGVAWTLRPVTRSPSARVQHVMVYDSRRQVTVLFGGVGYDGETQTYFGETWQWDGREWIRRAVGGPAPRALAAMAYDSDRDRLVLYGGTDSYSRGDTWVGRVPVAGDANGDDAVDALDLLILVEQFGRSQGDPLFDARADFDTTGAVDVADLLEIVGRWGWQASAE